MIIIGDIAGNLKTLKALLSQMPKDDFIALGDIIDRGPKSKEVLDFIMENGKSLMGNHEHMMIDKFESEQGIFNGSQGSRPYYRPHVWLDNGGLTTMESFFPGFTKEYEQNYELRMSSFVDKKYIDYLKSLPLYYSNKEVFLSHAPKNPHLKLKDANNLGAGFYWDFGYDYKSEGSLLWHRGSPAPYRNKLQVYGHNAYQEVLYHTISNPAGVFKKDLDDSKIFAIGIDTSRAKILTALHLPSMTIYQQEYID